MQFWMDNINAFAVNETFSETFTIDLPATDVLVTCALQQVGHVRQLEHMDPADPCAQAGRARHHLRAASAHHIQAEQIAHGGKHRTKRKARA